MADPKAEESRVSAVTNRKAPLEVLEALAEAVTVARERGWTLPTNVEPAHDAYRSATAPLQPPDLARLLRRLHVETQRCNACTAGECDWHDLQRVVRAFTTLSEDAQSAAYDCRLCSEPTRDEPEPERISDRRCRRCDGLFATPVERLSHEGACANATTDHDADLREPERCGCEEAEALKAKLANIRTEWGLWRADKKNGYAALVSIGTLLRNE